MLMEIRTAVIAAASPGVRSSLVRALSAAGMELLGAAQNGLDALHLLEKLQPDLLAADENLPVMDGCTLARRVLGRFELPVRPAVLLLHDSRFPLPDTQALCGAVLLEKPLREEAVPAALVRLRQTAAVFAPHHLRRIEDLLVSLGVPNHPGRECLKYAALICASDVRCLHNLASRVYPLVGEMCACTADQAQRAMRHVIESAWQSDQFDNQYRIFADTVDARRGQPTLREMIFRLADILRLEG